MTSVAPELRKMETLPVAMIVPGGAFNHYTNLICACGHPFGSGKAAETHFSECAQFKAKFGELFEALIGTAKRIRTRNDYDIVKYLFHLQKYYIRIRLKSLGDVKRQIPMFNPNPSQFNEEDKTQHNGPILAKRDLGLQQPPMIIPPVAIIAPSCVVDMKAHALEPRLMPSISESMIPVPQIASPVPQIPQAALNFNPPSASISIPAAVPMIPAPANKDELEEEKIIASGAAPVGTLVTCEGCSRQFAEGSNTLYLSCMHSYCTDCIKNKIFREYPDSGQVQCKCSRTMTDGEMQALIGTEPFEKLQKQYYKVMADKAGLVVCTCGNMFELVASKADPNQRDDKGKKLSKEAGLNMGKFRVRCNVCEKNFCAKCREYPYHIGYTCEEYRFYKTTIKCRYCKQEISKKGKKAGDIISDVCKKKECIKISKTACNKTLPCGHHCCGFVGEQTCLPCLAEECVKKDPQKTFNQTEDSYCPICYTSGLGDMPTIMPDCGHMMHVDCLMQRLKKRWPGPRVTFFFAECPSCRRFISAPKNPEVAQELARIKVICDDVRTKALQRMKFEGLEVSEKHRLTDPKDIYFNKPEELALAKLSYYMCFKCNVPYFGGLKSCENDNDGQQSYKANELICGKCAATGSTAGIKTCKTHGTEYIEYKCKFCCSVAQWYCWGSTHFCQSCHTKQAKGDYVSKYPVSKLPKCPGPALCPLKVSHPANGTEYAIGCAICRNHLENYKQY